MAEVGDRVKLKAQLPDLKQHVGWRDPDPNTPEDDGSVEVSWSEHFGGRPGVVDAVDVPNDQVRVRGFDARGQAFTIWIGHEYLDVTRSALDFEGEG